MYAFIRGAIADIYAERVVLEAAGVGYELFCSGNTLRTLKAGETAKLYTHLHLADGIMALYGFADAPEREMFRRLIGVTRVGPKLALSVLSVLSPADVAAAIVTNNEDALSRVPGMGKKTAQRVLLELKEKVSARDMSSAGISAIMESGAGMRADAVAALVSLGYDGISAQKAVMQAETFTGIEELITQALRSLSIQ
ncbi:MAG: Holliday junction branch migration protein RuvA [Clostridiales bacterium]|jgi:Holliday junction DNA helicase RuvA|nr:Holliday junction branch migration protein RuvA [Clostridiales bacterium]